MKKKNISRIYGYVLHQIYNEKRSNWALLAELLIVSCIVWYIVDCTYVIVSRAVEPLGFDITNCYKVNIGKLNESSVGYDSAYPENEDCYAKNKLALIDRIRKDEDIETAAYSNQSDPFSGSSTSSYLVYDTISSMEVRYIMCEPEFLKVFRIGSIDGKSPEQLASLLKDRNVFLTEHIFDGKYDIMKQVGKNLKFNYNGGDHMPWRITAVIPTLKRFSFEEIYNSPVLMMPFEQWIYGRPYMCNAISLRVKEGRTLGFVERFREKIKGKKIREGNYYISDIASYETLKKDSEISQDAQTLYYVVAIVFLLINVFLGLLGTFWFRTQHRFPEIGLQKAIGATNTDITLRLLAEAVLLLTIAFIPSLLIDLNIAHAGLPESYQGVTLATGRFITCAAISYLLMLLIIGLGICFPALKAVKANPVDVLRGE